MTGTLARALHLRETRHPYRAAKLKRCRRETGGLAAASLSLVRRLRRPPVRARGAGGSDYLLEFVEARIVSENILRHGLVNEPIMPS